MDTTSRLHHPFGAARKDLARALLAMLCMTLLIAGSGSVASADLPGCGPADHAGGEWPTYGRDLENTRNQEFETTISPANVGDLEPAWVLSVADLGGNGTIETAPMIADGCLYIATQSGTVIAANADTGALVWMRALGFTVQTVAVQNGMVFAGANRAGSPKLVAMDQETGQVLWETVVTTVDGAGVLGSPVAFKDLVVIGTTCPGEGASGAQRLVCSGGFAIVRQDGTLLGNAWVIPEEEVGATAGGASVWATPAIDEEEGYAYIGSGNPFGQDTPRSNALLKIDVDPSRSTFATIVDSFKGTPEAYFPQLQGARAIACDQSGYNFATCELPDMDMAVAATIYHDARGRKLVGVGQGSGVYFSVTADTMEYAWSATEGGPYLGHRAGGGAYDGERIYVPGGIPGHLVALDKNNGDIEWVSPAGIGNNSFNPLAFANGVVYALGGTNRPPFTFGMPSPSYLAALDAETGAVLLARPFAGDIGDVSQGSVAGGVIVARNTVYAPVNGLRGGYLVAYKLP